MEHVVWVKKSGLNHSLPSFPFFFFFGFMVYGILVS